MSRYRTVNYWLVAGTVLGASLALLRAPFLRAQVPSNQSPATASSPVQNTPGGTVKVQSNLVLVDAVVTDKKDNYIHGLEAKDFHVYEDDKEQAVASFSVGSGTSSPQAPNDRHYMVLFFDDSSIPNPADQLVARKAAAKFVNNIPAGRQVAVVDFGGTLRITQNFTDNGDVLKAAVSDVKFSSVGSGSETGFGMTQVASLGGAGLGASSDFGARTMLLAIRSLAKNLQPIRGRKSVVLFSAGFPLTPERQSEMTATVDACNKANVAVYPVDVRGLVAEPMNGIGQPGLPGAVRGPGANLFNGIDESAFPHEDRLLAFAFPPEPVPGQRPGGGGGVGGGGSISGGGAGGGRSGGTGGGAGGAGGTTGSGGRGGTGGTGTGSTGSRSTGTGSTGTGGTRSGGTVTNTGGNTGRGGGGNNYNNGYNNYMNPYNNPLYRQQQIIPLIPVTVGTNQQVLYALATGTGGFTILNTNDFLSGIEKVSKELDEYYVIGYVPPAKSPEGGCHTLKVKLSDGGYQVRSRSGYCDVKSRDVLAGAPEGKELETLATSPQAGNVSLALKAPYFYTAPNVARVNLALQIPGDALNFDKEKGKYESKLNVLGIACRQDGSVAARFSDKVTLSLDKKGMKDLVKELFSYQNTFDIAPGAYVLKVVLSPGSGSFAKLETPLVIAPYDGKKFGLSAVAMSAKFMPLSQLAADLEASLLEEKPPLVARSISNGQTVDVQLIPSPSNQFERSERVAFYVEVYEPLLLGAIQPRVGIDFTVLNKKTNQQVFDSGTVLVTDFVNKGNPVIPVGTMVPTENLQAGDYRLDVTARDSANNVSPVSSTEFQLN